MPSADERYADRSLGKRAGAISASIAIHILALIALVLWRTEESLARTPALATFDVTQPGPPVTEPPKQEQPIEVPPQPPEPIVVPPIFWPAENEMVVALLEKADASPAGGGCDLTSPVQAALRQNPQVYELLPEIQRDRLSVAKALAVWKDTWAEPDQQLPEEVLETIRETVRLTILAASDACRMQLQVGPRLIFLPDGEDTVTIALGSGQWTWQQVADSADPEYLNSDVSVASEDPASRAASWIANAVFGVSDRSRPKRPNSKTTNGLGQQEKE